MDSNLAWAATQIFAFGFMVAILSGFVIFPAAFSVGISPDSGPSLIFITLPNVFSQAFASVPWLGYIVSLLFFVLLSVAALTSLISLHEVSTAFIHDDLQTTRRKAAFIVTVVTAVIGTFCSLSLGAVEGLSLFGRSLFDCFDFLTGQILLPVGGFLTCLFLGWYVPRQVVYDEFTNGGTLRGRFFQFFLFLVRFVCPLAILCIFLDELGVI
jgi:NSS family neurotransmitter:Na+ symporter